MRISDFQDMMRRLYFQRDSRRGAKGTYEWLVDEVKELGDALENGDTEELAGEFADAIAWLASLANVVNVDLEKVTVAKYNNKCPKCKRTPCQCPSMRALTGASVQRP
jgi:NTP pyrophosphatase (non-canonical NTP hydrolase)